MYTVQNINSLDLEWENGSAHGKIFLHNFLFFSSLAWRISVVAVIIAVAQLYSTGNELVANQYVHVSLFTKECKQILNDTMYHCN